MLDRIKRVFKHQWLDDAELHRAVPPEMLERLQTLIASSEQAHSGEIQLVIEARLPLRYLWRKESTEALTHQRALSVFSKTQVWDTANNNGVLIYLLLAERSIEILADRGLSQMVDASDWQRMVQHMRDAFRQGQFEAGLTETIGEVTQLLVQHFALKAGEVNPNELPDYPVLR